MVTRSKVERVEQLIYSSTDQIPALGKLVEWTVYSRSAKQRKMMYATLCNILQHFIDIKIIDQNTFNKAIIQNIAKPIQNPNATEFVCLQYISLIKYAATINDSLSTEFIFGIAKVLCIDPRNTLIYDYMLTKITSKPITPNTIETLAHDYVWAHIDISYAFLKFAANPNNLKRSITPIINILMEYAKVEDPYNENLIPGEFTSVVKEMLSKLCSSLLGNPDINSADLPVVIKCLLPHVDNPLKLVDSVIAKYNSSKDSLKVLWLHCIYQFIIAHSYDYPAFFKELYSLIEYINTSSIPVKKAIVSMLCSLASSQIDTIILRSFIKKCSVLLSKLNQSSLEVLLITILRVISKHKDLKPMLQCLAGKAATADMFDYTQCEFEKTGADNTSLWEIETLKNHYRKDIRKILFDFINDPMSIELYDPIDMCNQTEDHIKESILKGIQSENVDIDCILIK